MEIFDVVDEVGNPIGDTVERSIAHADGVRHRTAHIWIARRQNDKWQVLLQKRSLTKDSFPGRFDTSSAGHIQAGDEPLESAMRELKEELGVEAKPEDLRFVGTFCIQFEKEFHHKTFKDNEIAFVYIYLKNVDIDKITVQKEELESVEWFDLDFAYNQCIAHDPRFCVPIKGLEMIRNYLLREFTDKVVVVTGGAHGIGKKTRELFEKEGAVVEVIDMAEGNHYVGDISKKEVLEAFAEYVIEKHGRVDYLINNAMPLMRGIDTCSYEEFEYALAVGVTAPFYLTKLFKNYFVQGASVVNISSSRDRMSQPQTESYTAAKGGIAALTHALAVSLAGIARVNSISPGWIETGDAMYEGPDAEQQPVGRVGKTEDIANMILYLCSDKASFISGENICIDGGMTKQMVYHGEHGWIYHV